MRIEADLPLSLADIDTAFLTRVMREAGVFQDHEVERFDYQVIGEGVGFLGEIARITLQHNHPTAPRSIIVKIPTAGMNRKFGQLLGVYEREIRFYSDTELARDVRTPVHYFSAMDAADDPQKAIAGLRLINRMPLWFIPLFMKFMTWLGSKGKARRYVLAMEDLGAFRPADQIAGCSITDAERALKSMAALHAQFWGQQALRQWLWIIPIDASVKIFQSIYQSALPKFLAAEGHKLTPRHKMLLTWLEDNGLKLVDAYAGTPYTLLHGDFRLDNLCFDDASGEVVLFDWQTLINGPPGLELAYFLSASLDTSATTADEDDLLMVYHAALQARGIKVTIEQIRWGYQLGMMMLLQRLVPANYVDNLDFSDERGQLLLGTWVDRILHKVEAIDVDELLTRVPA